MSTVFVLLVVCGDTRVYVRVRVTRSVRGVVVTSSLPTRGPKRSLEGVGTKTAVWVLQVTLLGRSAREAVAAFATVVAVKLSLSAYV